MLFHRRRIFLWKLGHRRAVARRGVLRGLVDLLHLLGVRVREAAAGEEEVEEAAAEEVAAAAADGETAAAATVDAGGESSKHATASALEGAD